MFSRFEKTLELKLTAVFCFIGFFFEGVSIVSRKYKTATEQKKGLTPAPNPVANRVDINVKPLTFQNTLSEM